MGEGKVVDKNPDENSEQSTAPAEPPRARTRKERHSALRSGRTIGEHRDHLETANERIEARRKVKKHKALRFFFTVLAFMALAGGVVYFIFFVVLKKEIVPFESTVSVPYAPTIEVIDEDAGSNAKLSASMKEYIGMAEADFRELGYVPVKVVRPVNSIREVDFYLDGVPGYIKLTTDRATGVSVEDADRMIRYLRGQEINEYTYIDVRIDRKAYWK